MSETSLGFAHWADLYRAQGYWPRPVKPESKAAAVSNWQRPDDEFQFGELKRWSKRYANAGIGILLGSPFPDGTKLAALDIDQDDYLRLGRALLLEPACGRIGERGIALFARIRGDGKYRAFKAKIEDGPDLKVGELLCERRFCVLPPSIHPKTERPYRWVGSSLLDVDYRDLPIIEA